MAPSQTEEAPTSLSAFEQKIKDEAIGDGENLRRLKELRKTVTKEMGDDWVKSMQTSHPIIDLFFNILLPGLSCYYILLVWEVDFTNPRDFVLYYFWSGWVLMLQGSCFHDITHRLPFGYVGTRVLAKLMSFQIGVGEHFYQRHRQHHAKFGERDDPKMRRFWTCRNTGWMRLIGLFLPFIQGVVEVYHQRFAAKKWEGRIKINHTILRLEQCVQLVGLSAVFYTWGFTHGFTRFFIMTCGAMVFNTFRLLFEHGGQDLKNPYTQGVWYESGWLLRFLFAGGPGFDLHHWHHTFPKMPNYKLLIWGDQMNPVIEKLGVKKYNSVWTLIYNYFILNKDYGREWHIDFA